MTGDQILRWFVGLALTSGAISYIRYQRFDPFLVFRFLFRWGWKQLGRGMRSIVKTLKNWGRRISRHAGLPTTSLTGKITLHSLAIGMRLIRFPLAVVTDAFFGSGKEK